MGITRFMKSLILNIVNIILIVLVVMTLSHSFAIKAQSDELRPEQAFSSALSQQLVKDFAHTTTGIKFLTAHWQDQNRAKLYFINSNLLSVIIFFKFFLITLISQKIRVQRYILANINEIV